METDIDMAAPFAVFTDPIGPEIAAIAETMRYEDVRECEAWGLTPQSAAAGISACEHAWVVYQYQHPVFVVGLKQYMPSAYYLCGFASSRIEKCTLRALTRWGIKTWIPALFDDLGVRRVEALIPTYSSHSFKWLTWVGMTIEGRARDFIREGQDFFRLSYTITDFQNEYRNDVFYPEGAAPITGGTKEVEHRNPA